MLGVLLGVVVVDVDGVLLVAVALLDAVDAVGLRIVPELEEGRGLVDAAPAVHLELRAVEEARVVQLVPI